MLLEPLMVLTNASLQMGVFPELMKIAHVSPLYKSGSMVMCTNYRPISLLPVLSKIIEKVMHSRLYNFLQGTNQIYQSQYGFCKTHSCEHAIQELLSTILKGCENKKYTAAIFLDLSKAFDTLEHGILLKKLVYSNDLPLNLDTCNSILFADDTTLYKSHANLRYLKWSLQHKMSILMDWFRANKLTLNLSKSVCMLFNGNISDINFSLEIDEYILPRMSCTKFLGVWINEKLNWD